MSIKMKYVAAYAAGVLLTAGGLTLAFFSTDHSSAGNLISSDQKVSSVLHGEDGGKKVSPITISGIPIRIEIPELSIDLKVVPGYYNYSQQSWTLSLNNAQYAAMFGPTNNQKGETFIYAHNRKGVFYTLPNIMPGSKAVLTTDNGHKFKYTYRTSIIVPPSNTTSLYYTGKPILIAQTCTGQWYQNRQLFVFDLTEAT